MLHDFAGCRQCLMLQVFAGNVNFECTTSLKAASKLTHPLPAVSSRGGVPLRVAGKQTCSQWSTTIPSSLTLVMESQVRLRDTIPAFSSMRSMAPIRPKEIPNVNRTEFVCFGQGPTPRQISHCIKRLHGSQILIIQRAWDVYVCV